MSANTIQSGRAPGLVRLDVDAADDAVRAGGGGDLDEVAVGSRALDDGRQVDSRRVERHATPPRARAGRPRQRRQQGQRAAKARTGRCVAKCDEAALGIRRRSRRGARPDESIGRSWRGQGGAQAVIDAAIRPRPVSVSSASSAKSRWSCQTPLITDSARLALALEADLLQQAHRRRRCGAGRRPRSGAAAGSRRRRRTAPRTAAVM